MKEQLQQKFQEIFGSDYRLLAIQLDGFSHRVYFDEGSDSYIESLEHSGYAPEIKADPRVVALLGDIPHYCYQGNAQEIIYVMPNER